MTRMGWQPCNSFQLWSSWDLCTVVEQKLWLVGKRISEHTVWISFGFNQRLLLERERSEMSTLVSAWCHWDTSLSWFLSGCMWQLKWAGWLSHLSEAVSTISPPEGNGTLGPSMAHFQNIEHSNFGMPSLRRYKCGCWSSHWFGYQVVVASSN